MPGLVHSVFQIICVIHIHLFQKWMHVIKWKVCHISKNNHSCSLSQLRKTGQVRGTSAAHEQWDKTTESNHDARRDITASTHTGQWGRRPPPDWWMTQWSVIPNETHAGWKTLHAGRDFARFLNRRENLRQVYKTDYYHFVRGFIWVLLYGCVILFLTKKVWQALDQLFVLVFCYLFIIVS